MDEQNIVEAHPKWNNKEFIAFLLLYSALADKVITDAEKAMIRKKVNEDVYNQILEEIQSGSDDELKQILLSYKGWYFPTLAQRQELLHLAKKEFYVDQDFSEVEMELYKTLKSIM